ncbi:UDP-glucuronosyl/UDP-glucosyltransferase [Caballeronia fortuita]|uniref:UDP-glucuronosyl/UDP-glucosyltransferase n=1 Tax=Caballeronia fortuita TaxID=1777138 RepID=A0A158CTQ4_9BURK|nr:glycosyltransferase [Caballeronia fortuita]SAK85763.1 UDP-glucuronosyl/UDP-glucosyltransferase [Caballeronia fortuita]
MRVLLSSVPLVGHLNPILSVGKALIDAGHDVIGMTSTSLRHKISGIGGAFRPLQGEANRDLSDFAVAFPEFSQMKPGLDMTKFYFERVFADPLIDQYTSLCNVLDELPIDLVVTDNLFFGAIPLLLKHPRCERPPIAFCGTTYLLSRRDDLAPCNLGLPFAEPKAYASIAEEVDKEFLAPFASNLNALLLRAGSPPLHENIFDATARLPDLHLQLTVPSFEFPRSNLPAPLRYVGALPIMSGQAPLPPWSSELDGSRRVVLVTQGTLSNHDFSQLVSPALDALADRSDLLVVVTAGGRCIDSIPGRIPFNARIAKYLPFEWLLPKIDLLVTNGGYGTVNQALAHGIPVIGAGQSEDKADVNARIAWSGVGIDLQTDRPSVDAIRTAVDTVMSKPHFSMRARQMSQEHQRVRRDANIVGLLESLSVA